MIPILVTGAPRSGVSLTAGLVRISGAFGGNCGRPQHRTNRFTNQNLRIRTQVVKPFLSGLHLDAHQESPDLGKLWELAPKVARNWRAGVIRILRAEGYRSGPWFYKCPVAGLIWPVWRTAFPEARWVLVDRPEEAVVDACMKTSYMRAHSTREGWVTWLRNYRERTEALIESGLSAWRFEPDPLFHGELQGLRALIEWLGLKWDKERISEYLAPALWKSGVYEMTG